MNITIVSMVTLKPFPALIVVYRYVLVVRFMSLYISSANSLFCRCPGPYLRFCASTAAHPHCSPLLCTYLHYHRIPRAGLQINGGVSDSEVGCLNTIRGA